MFFPPNTVHIFVRRRADLRLRIAGRCAKKDSGPRRWSYNNNQTGESNNGHCCRRRDDGVVMLGAPPPIESRRLRIRLVQASDIADLLEVNGDEEVTRFPYATWRSLADGEAWLARMNAMNETGTAIQFAILEKSSGRAIGTLLLFRYDEGSQRAELGYVMGRARWGQGLAHEALTALIEFAFGHAGIRRLEAHVDPANVASNSLLLKLGFVLEGRLRENWNTKGTIGDTNVYGLLSREWGSA
jgi:[ribosomal protein S5]-alanine N-acetyltransferase